MVNASVHKIRIKNHPYYKYVNNKSVKQYVSQQKYEIHIINSEIMIRCQPYTSKDSVSSTQQLCNT